MTVCGFKVIFELARGYANEIQDIVTVGSDFRMQCVFS